MNPDSEHFRNARRLQDYLLPPRILNVTFKSSGARYRTHEIAATMAEEEAEETFADKKKRASLEAAEEEVFPRLETPPDMRAPYFLQNSMSFQRHPSPLAVRILGRSLRLVI